jgi:hypothetical protein
MVQQVVQGRSQEEHRFHAQFQQRAERVGGTGSYSRLGLAGSGGYRSRRQ